MGVYFFTIGMVLGFLLNYFYDIGEIAGITIAIRGIVSLMFAMICGGSASAIYCHKFIYDLQMAGYPNKSAEEVLPAVRRRGGYNNWAAAVGVIINVASIAVFSFAVYSPSKEAIVETNAVGLVNELLARNDYDDFICEKVSVFRKLSDRMYICHAYIDKYSGTMYVSAKYICEIMVTLEGDKITVELRGEPILLKEDP